MSSRSALRSSQQCPELLCCTCWSESFPLSLLPFSQAPTLTLVQSTFPVIDGDFLQQSPTLQLQAGSFVKVPFLIGANHDEGTAFGPRGINTTAEVAAYIQEAYTTDNSSINILLALYPDIPEIGIPGTFHGRPGADLGLMYKRTSGSSIYFPLPPLR